MDYRDLARDWRDSVQRNQTLDVRGGCTISLVSKEHLLNPSASASVPLASVASQATKLTDQHQQLAWRLVGKPPLEGGGGMHVCCKACFF